MFAIPPSFSSHKAAPFLIFSALKFICAWLIPNQSKNGCEVESLNKETLSNKLWSVLMNKEVSYLNFNDEGNVGCILSMGKQLCCDEGIFVRNGSWERNKRRCREIFSFFGSLKALKLFVRKFRSITQYWKSFQEQPLQSNESNLISTSQIKTQVFSGQ